MASYQPSHASSRYFVCACVCVCGIPACYFSHCFSCSHLSHVLFPPPPYLWDVILYSDRQPLSRTLASHWIWIQFLVSHTNSGSLSVLFFFFRNRNWLFPHRKPNGSKPTERSSKPPECSRIERQASSENWAICTLKTCTKNTRCVCSVCGGGYSQFPRARIQAPCIHIRSPYMNFPCCVHLYSWTREWKVNGEQISEVKGRGQAQITDMGGETCCIFLVYAVGVW